MNVRKPRYCLNCNDGAILELGVKDVIVQAAHVTKTAPPKSTLLLLNLLDRHPEPLRELA
jgi:hypothetical protein